MFGDSGHLGVDQFDHGWMSLERRFLFVDVFSGSVFFGRGVGGGGGAGLSVVEEGGALGERVVGGGGAVAVAYGAW